MHNSWARRVRSMWTLLLSLSFSGPEFSVYWFIPILLDAATRWTCAPPTGSLRNESHKGCRRHNVIHYQARREQDQTTPLSLRLSCRHLVSAVEVKEASFVGGTARTGGRLRRCSSPLASPPGRWSKRRAAGGHGCGCVRSWRRGDQWKRHW